MKNKISKHIFIKKKNYRYIILILVLIITFTALYLYRLNADQIANSWVKNKVHITYENAAGKSVSIDSNIVTTKLSDVTLNEVVMPPNSYNTGWNMISFSNIDFDSDRSFIPSTYNIKEFDTVANKYIDPPTLAPGKGYWMKVDDVSKLKDKKYNSYPLDSYTIDVSKGWNLLGNPFETNLSIENIKIVMKNGAVKTIQQAKESKDILGYAWSYERNDKAYNFISPTPERYKTSAKKQQYISVNRGFWLYVKNNEVLNIMMVR